MNFNETTMNEIATKYYNQTTQLIQIYHTSIKHAKTGNFKLINVSQDI